MSVKKVVFTFGTIISKPHQRDQFPFDLAPVLDQAGESTERLGLLLSGSPSFLEVSVDVAGLSLWLLSISLAL
jgi:hypothetical protein